MDENHDKQDNPEGMAGLAGMTREEKQIANALSVAIVQHDWRPLSVRYNAAWAAIKVLRADEQNGLKKR